MVLAFRYTNRLARGVEDGARAAFAILGAKGKRVTYNEPTGKAAKQGGLDKALECVNTASAVGGVRTRRGFAPYQIPGLARLPISPPPRRLGQQFRVPTDHGLLALCFISTEGIITHTLWAGQ